MNTTQQKLNAISREPVFASYRIWHKLRVLYEDFQARERAAALPLKTKALLVVFAGMGAITILELARADYGNLFLAPPKIAAAHAPAGSAQATLAEPTILTESLRRYAELNQATVVMLVLPGGAQGDNTSPAAADDQAIGRQREPARVYQLPRSSPAQKTTQIRAFSGD